MQHVGSRASRCKRKIVQRTKAERRYGIRALSRANIVPRRLAERLQLAFAGHARALGGNPPAVDLRDPGDPVGPPAALRLPRAGDELGEGTVLRFTFDGSDPATEAWLGDGLDRGRIVFSLSSLIEAEQEGGDFIDLYMRENPLVTVGVRSAATLRIEGSIAKGCNRPGDLDHDCTVGGGDIGIMLSVWGTDDPEADLDGNGMVDGADFGLLLTLFGT